MGIILNKGMQKIVKQLYSHSMRIWLNNITAVMVLAITMMSCNDVLDQSLELAGDNRQELEKVLTYFEDDEDPLKYEAACFLIENMPYHGTFYGRDLEKYVNSYGADGTEPETCYNTVTTKKGSTILYCGGCVYVDGTDAPFSGTDKCNP